MAEETLVRGYAVLASDPEDDEAAGPYMVHGVAIGVDDVTFGMSGVEKVWPADALREAADSLAGKPIVKNHINQDVDAVVGQVTKAHFEEAVGVVYEGEIDDRDLALKVKRGRLDVSPMIAHGDPAEMEENEEGALIVDEVHEFINLSLVTRGAAPSNSIAEGPAEALSGAELAAFFEEPAKDDPEEPEAAPDAPEVTDDPEPADDPEDPEALADEPVDDVEDDVSTENRPSVTPEDPDEAATDEWAESLLARVSADEHLSTAMDSKEKLLAHLEAQAEELGCEPEDLAFVPKGTKEELNDEITDLEDEVAELTKTNETLTEEVSAVKEAYAEALADDALWTTEDLMDRFDVAELREKYDAAVEAETIEPLGTEPEPAPKSGDVDELADEEDEPEAGLSAEEQEEVESLKANIEALAGKSGGLAVAQREVFEERLTELTGESE